MEKCKNVRHFIMYKFHRFWIRWHLSVNLALFDKVERYGRNESDDMKVMKHHTKFEHHRAKAEMYAAYL